MDFMHTLPAMTNGSLSKTAAGMDSIFLNKVNLATSSLHYPGL